VPHSNAPASAIDKTLMPALDTALLIGPTAVLVIGPTPVLRRSWSSGILWGGRP
jgi:hypothetical protein